MDVKIRVYLPRKYGRFMLFIDNNLLLPGARLHILNNIYENDHRHHLKFIKYEKRLRKKVKSCSDYLPVSSKIFATSARVWTHSTSMSSFQRSNWSPTYILHLFHLEDTSLLFIFLSESAKVRFLPRVDTFSFAQEPHVVYCF
jgi:hypothetical protein